MKSALKIQWKTEIFSLFLILGSFALGFYFYNLFPERVISHWNFAGEADGYSGKFFGAFGLPLMNLGIYLVFLFLPILDPKRERYAAFEKVYHVFRIAFLSVLTAIYVVLGLVNLGYNVPVNRVVPFLVGILMIVIGNFMGKIKSNWFIGIRTPWTLASENVWNKTHRVGGWLFIVFGLIIMVTPFLDFKWGMGLFIAGVVALIFGSTVYSYLVYRKEKQIE